MEQLLKVLVPYSKILNIPSEDGGGEYSVLILDSTLTQLFLYFKEWHLQNPLSYINICIKLICLGYEQFNSPRSPQKKHKKKNEKKS